MSTSKRISDSLDIQERDLDLLRGLFESRIMTAEHVATLYFEGKREAAKKRLQKLKAARFLGERKRRVYEPSVLFLTSKSATLLRERGILAEYPRIDPATLEKRARVSELTLRHELEVIGVKAAFRAAIRKADNLSIAEFTTWPLLNQFEACRTGYGGTEFLVKPDGFIRLRETQTDGGLMEYTFFLEVDRSTETLSTLIVRAGCYLDYFKSGGFAVRNGASRLAYKDYPFRVLMVFKTAERRNNAAEKLLQNHPPILTHVWLSTFKEVISEPLGAIWVRPVDYRDATNGTPFDSKHSRSMPGYRRQIDRELLVDHHVKKISLLG